jgi:hypothetical protein
MLTHLGRRRHTPDRPRRAMMRCVPNILYTHMERLHADILRFIREA